MPHFHSFTLSNGLRVMLASVPDAQTVVCNVLYGVGSRDESPDKTGLAHLFEHLMFGGSSNVPHYDQAVQQAGGHNNAFTSFDITNYYAQLPAANLETLLWVESDRMVSGATSAEVLEVQRKVVTEEFHEVCLNKPYGDLFHHLLPLAYTDHPYGWPVIGKTTDDIASFTMEDVRAFARRYYTPSNAILVVAGGLDLAVAEPLVAKWFETIPGGSPVRASRPEEPLQEEERHKVVRAYVPLDMIYKAYHMPGRTEQGYAAAKAVAYMVGDGEGSQLYQALVVRDKVLTNVATYTLDTVDKGLLIIEAQPAKGVPLDVADGAVMRELVLAQQRSIKLARLAGIQHRLHTHYAEEEQGITGRAQHLAMAAWLGAPDFFVQELQGLAKLSLVDLLDATQKMFAQGRANTLYYEALPAGAPA